MTPGEPEFKKAIERKRLPGWAITLAAVLLFGFLAVIGGSLNKKSTPALNLGDPMPEFSVTTFSGVTYTTADMAGKVVVLNFWASWCTTCEEEAAFLQKAWTEMEPAGKVIFLGVAWADTQPEALGYMERFGVTYPSGPDLGTKVSQLFRISGVPETYIFDTNGKLAAVKIGPFESEAEIRSAIEKLLPEG